MSMNEHGESLLLFVRKPRQQKLINDGRSCRLAHRIEQDLGFLRFQRVAYPDQTKPVRAALLFDFRQMLFLIRVDGQMPDQDGRNG